MYWRMKKRLKKFFFFHKFPISIHLKKKKNFFFIYTKIIHPKKKTTFSIFQIQNISKNRKTTKKNKYKYTFFFSPLFDFSPFLFLLIIYRLVPLRESIHDLLKIDLGKLDEYTQNFPGLFSTSPRNFNVLAPDPLINRKKKRAGSINKDPFRKNSTEQTFGDKPILKASREKNIIPPPNNKKNQEDNSEDYINANFISIKQCSKTFISCQAPLPDTMFDFWRMVKKKKNHLLNFKI